MSRCNLNDNRLSGVEAYIRISFETFEAYCRERWDFNASRARQLIGAAEDFDNIKSVTTVTPKTEWQIRPLARLEPAQQIPARHGEDRCCALSSRDKTSDLSPRFLTTSPACLLRRINASSFPTALAYSDSPPVLPNKPASWLVGILHAREGVTYVLGHSVLTRSVILHARGCDFI